ncbi:MAG: hypothetical protein ACRDDY_13740 [Clostridium sp.]|uniref:hypothetical protein n=1 Tax=Clostridium sp. TaxID=1506 RepID=UPI003EE6C6C2
MARVIYVPKWVKESLDCNNETLHKTLIENPISDIFHNSHDLVSYVKAQLDFAKFLVSTGDISDCHEYAQGSELAKKVLERNSKAKDILFKDNWPANNADVNYAIRANAEVLEFELLHLDINATRAMDMQFEIFPVHLTPIIVVHGDSAPSDIESDTPETSKETQRKFAFLMRSILQAAYNQQSIHTGRLDHASFANQNETLLSLYVSSI